MVPDTRREVGTSRNRALFNLRHWLLFFAASILGIVIQNAVVYHPVESGEYAQFTKHN